MEPTGHVAAAASAGPATRRFSFLVPGDWHTPTGGFVYDRRLAEALGAAGWTVDVQQLDAGWPTPDAHALQQAEAAVAGIADGRTVVADGLAFGVLGPLVAAHATRLRWVALVHHPLHLETGLDTALRERLRASEAEALAWARQVVVTSLRTVQDVVALGVPRERIAVVEPGTDAGTPPGAAPSSEATPKPVRLLCVATVTPRKGHALLLRALAGLQQWPWQLHCVGSLSRDADTAAEAMALAQALGLASRVVWHGEVDAGALRAHYAAADLLVLASLHEGYGMAVAEALAAGLPVLASDAGALAQTLPAAAGLQVPAGDGLALQAALQRLISQPGLRQALAAGARAAGSLLPGWPAQAARFAAVLEAMD